MDRGSAAAASAFAAVAFVYLIVLCTVIAFAIFAIWLYWRIFTKAGYSGALSLLNLVPGVGHLICLIILAFGRWPIEDQLAAAQGMPISPSVPPPPPGTSVMPTS